MPQITIESVISTDTKPRITIKDQRVADNGTIYPAHLILKLHDFGSYIDKNNDEQETEKTYSIKINSDTLVNARDLQKVLKSTDFSKFPLQLVCEPFTADTIWANGKSVGSSFDKFSGDCKKSAPELIKLLKK